MRFKEGREVRLSGEYLQIHPDLRQLLDGLSKFSVESGLPVPLATDLIRSAKEQVEIYVAFWTKLLDSLTPGPHYDRIDPEGDGTWRPLTLEEKTQRSTRARDVAGRIAAEEKRQHKTLGPDERAQLQRLVLVEAAEKRFTWHWCRCAADLRSRHYTLAQLAQVAEWFSERCKKPQWEFLVHDVTAPHIHVARRDFGWREKYTPSPASPGGSP